MHNVLNSENENRLQVTAQYKSKASQETARITGLLCLGSASLSVFFAFASVLLPLGEAMAMIYFIFLLTTATLALIGYSEIKAAGLGWANTLLFLLSIVLLFVSFLYAIPGKNSARYFGFSYGLFTVFVPVLLTIVSLASRKAAAWKAVLPLAIPVLHAIAYLSFKSIGLSFALALLPVSWSLLGMVAYSERK